MSPTELPALYQSYSASSEGSQREFLRLTRASLVLLVLAAVAGAITLKRDNGPDWAGVIAVLAFVGAGAARLVLLIRGPERRWYDARAGAESVKTVAWSYAVAGGAFGRTVVDEEAAERRFLGRLREIIDQVVPGAPSDPSATQISAVMRQLRGAALGERIAAYRSGRLDNQIDWYTRKASWNEARAKMWSWATIAILALGLIGGLLKATGELEVDLLGLAAAAAAATTAWLGTKDHAGLAQAYAVTAHELALVRDELASVDSELRWSQFVHDAEHAISREHTLWRARRRAPG
jgi:hypothetical protein